VSNKYDNLVLFESSYLQTENDFGKDNPDVFESITIDGFPEDENEEGHVIAEVFITKQGDIVVAWYLRDYYTNEHVLAHIEECKTILRNDYNAVFA
jgi:hypothetical protein